MQIIWDLDDEPDGNVQHIAEHGLTKEEVDDVLMNLNNPTDARAIRAVIPSLLVGPLPAGTSLSSGNMFTMTRLPFFRSRPMKCRRQGVEP
jgi:hypothetical protein